MLDEPISSFVSSSDDLKRLVSSCKGSLSSQCEVAQQLSNSSYSGILHCSSETKLLDICKETRGEFMFREGRITAIEFMENNRWPAVVNTLSSLYGKPSSIEKGTGKSSGTLSAIWSTSTTRLSASGFENDPSTTPTVCVILQTSDHYVRAGQQEAKSQASHDEILSSYRDAETSLSHDQAKLLEGENKHEFAALLVSRKSMVDFDKNSLKMYELLLANEVRDDESNEASY